MALAMTYAGAAGRTASEMAEVLHLDRADLQPLNFGQPEQARRTINEWVAQQTRKKILDLVPSGLLSPDPRHNAHLAMCAVSS